MRLPYGYGTAEKTLEQTRSWLLEHHHPEYVARLCAWLESKGGHIGVGGGWRADGSQPDKPGFAPAGKSFHQNQRYSDGFIGAVAVDLVARQANSFEAHRAPYWSEVPPQESAEARRWGVHCNVGYPGSSGGESWHMQPVEIDGYDSFIRNGSPAPVADYPFPGRTAPPITVPPVPPLPESDIDMLSNIILWKVKGTANAFAVAFGVGATHLSDVTYPILVARLAAAGLSTMVHESVHPQEIKSVLFQAGIAEADLEQL